jgi:tRNA A-37 threonylcarbamoyl transferase component Bud32
MTGRDERSEGAPVSRGNDEREPVLDMAALSAAGRALHAPFLLRLDRDGIGEVWRCTRILRLLPYRRIVARATCGNSERLLKLFLGADAPRHAERDRRGVASLVRAGIRTPELFAHGRIAGGCFLMFEYLADAVPLSADDGAGRANIGMETGSIEAVIATLAHLHGAGMVHDDLHLDNFLRVGNDVYAIDGASIRRPLSGRVRDRLGRRSSLDNLAAFLAQFHRRAMPDLARAYGTYAGARGWESSASDIRSLHRRIGRARLRRCRQYLKKTVRDCTEFVVERRFDRFLACRRDEHSPGLGALLDDPDGHMRSGRLLKAGNSATLAAVSLGTRSYVVKRYNVKSFSHWLRRCWRPSRAWTAWRNAHRLILLGIDTARPVAMIERRAGPLRRTAYLVMEALPGPDLQQIIASREVPDENVLRAIRNMFDELYTAGLVHGDTKASNFIVGFDRVHLIDLDAMHIPWSARRLRARFNEDLRRFMANWNTDDPIRHHVETLMTSHAAMSHATFE